MRYLQILPLLVFLVLHSVAVTAQSDREAQEPIEISLSAGKSKIFSVSEKINALMLANEDVATVQMLSENSFYLLAKKPGTTNIQLVGIDGLPTRIYTLTVLTDLKMVEDALKSVLPQSEIKVIALKEGVGLSGTVKTISDKEVALSVAKQFSAEVVDAIEVAEPAQVYLTVDIVEIVSNSDLDVGGIPDPFGSLLASSVSGQSGSSSIISSRIEVQSVINLLVSDGKARYLASPVLSALSGTSSSFLAGGEYPITVQTDQGVETEFKEYGVRLEFTPQVTKNNRIQLTIKPEVSQIDASVDASGGAAFATRRAASTAVLAPGATMAIAGLYQSNTSRSKSGIPALGQLPLLGALFRNVRSQDRTTQLVIFVTPSFEHPSSFAKATSREIMRYEGSSRQELVLDGLLSKRKSDWEQRFVKANGSILKNYGHIGLQ